MDKYDWNQLKLSAIDIHNVLISLDLQSINH